MEAALARTKVVDDWVTRVFTEDADAAPPAHWVVRSESQLAGRPTSQRSKGQQKFVNASSVVVDGVSVACVLKSQKPKPTMKVKGLEGAEHKELLYLEYLRGFEGVPELFGAYVTQPGRAASEEPKLTVVEADGGALMGTGKGLELDPGRPSPTYDALARHRPLAVARAIFACFRSFAEVGGFILSDFKITQFVVDLDTAAVVLVDDPKIYPTNPLATYLRGHKSAANASADPEHALLRPCDREEQCKHTKAYHACSMVGQPHEIGDQNPCERGSRGAPEAVRRCVNHTCVPLNYKTHVFDVAAKIWLLPFIIEMAQDRDASLFLDGLARTMQHPDPARRPSFTDLLAKVDRRIAAAQARRATSAGSRRRVGT